MDRFLADISADEFSEIGESVEELDEYPWEVPLTEAVIDGDKEKVLDILEFSPKIRQQIGMKKQWISSR